MLGRKSMLLGMTCCLGLAASLAANAECVPDPGRETIKVAVGAEGTPVVTPDSVTACEGETLRWVFQGADAKEFSVIFVDADKSPFEWSRQTGATISGTVKSGAARNGKKTEYKYDVDVDGKVLDPKIIIDR
jgi:plastocyanin